MTMQMVFKVFQAFPGHYFFTLSDCRGSNLLSMGGFLTREGCLRGIAVLKGLAGMDDRYYYRGSEDKNYFFDLIGRDGRTVATSVLFRTAAERDKAIAAIKMYVSAALVSDTD